MFELTDHDIDIEALRAEHAHDASGGFVCFEGWVRDHNDGLLIHFEGVNDRNAAEALQGLTFTISPEERRRLGEDEYWPEDLEGLTAITSSGVHLGQVTGVILGQAQDRLVVKTQDGREVEVPFVSEIVGEIHPSLGHVVVNPPEGLF